MGRRRRAFGPRQLYVGGPVETSRLHVLHGSPGIADSYEVIDGLFMGGVTDAAEKFLRGELSLKGFK